MFENLSRKLWRVSVGARRRHVVPINRLPMIICSSNRSDSALMGGWRLVASLALLQFYMPAVSFIIGAPV